MGNTVLPLFASPPPEAPLSLPELLTVPHLTMMEEATQHGLLNSPWTYLSQVPFETGYRYHNVGSTTKRRPQETAPTIMDRGHTGPIPAPATIPPLTPPNGTHYNSQLQDPTTATDPLSKPMVSMLLHQIQAHQ